MKYKSKLLNSECVRKCVKIKFAEYNNENVIKPSIAHGSKWKIILLLSIPQSPYILTTNEVF